MGELSSTEMAQCFVHLLTKDATFSLQQADAINKLCLGEDANKARLNKGIPRLRVKKRKNEDPAAPRKPKAAYWLFQEKMHDELMKKCKQVGETAQTVGGKAWKALSPEERKVYQEEAEVKKAEYEQAVAEYRLQHPEAGIGVKQAKVKRAKMEHVEEGEGKALEKEEAAKKAGDEDDEEDEESEEDDIDKKVGYVEE
ncbi:unnamed protein product [Chrysoparadoxa australica]